MYLRYYTLQDVIPPVVVRGCSFMEFQLTAHYYFIKVATWNGTLDCTTGEITSGSGMQATHDSSNIYQYAEPPAELINKDITKLKFKLVISFNQGTEIHKLKQTSVMPRNGHVSFAVKGKSKTYSIYIQLVQTNSYILIHFDIIETKIS